MAAVEHFIENEISFVARGRFKEYLSKIALVRLSTDEWRDLFDLLETIYDEIANGETELSEVEEEKLPLQKEEKKDIEKPIVEEEKKD